MTQSNNKLKKVLMITYYYPPMSTVAIHRIMRYAKHLSDYGWQPIILTVNKGSVQSDNDLLKNLDINISVNRTYSFEPFNLNNPLFSYTYNSLKEEKSEHIKGKYLNNIIFKIARKLYHVFLYIVNIFMIPDNTIGWLPFAVLKGRKIIRGENIDIIYATGGPFTCFLIGFFLMKFYKKPLVLDYRDQLTGHVYHNETPYQFRIVKKIQEKLLIFIEKKIIKYSKKIIFVSDMFRRTFMLSHKEISQNRFITITNGYNDYTLKSIKNVSKTANNKKLTFVYSGTLYGPRIPKYFLTAIDQLIDEKKINKDRVEIIFIGTIMNKEIFENINNMKYNQVVKVLGQIPYKEALYYIKISDVLLLIMGNTQLDKIAIPVKVFEYFLTNNFILGLTPKKSELDRIILESNTGKVIDPQDVAGIMKIVEKLYKEFINNGKIDIHPNKSYLEKFNSKKLTQELSNVFNQVIKEN